MLVSSVFRCFCTCVPTFHVLLYRCYGVPSFVFTYSGILVPSAPVYITFSSLSNNVEGVFNSVVAGKFVGYFQPSWRSTRFLPESPNPFSFYFWEIISAQERPACKEGFLFNNWAISRALIGGCSIRVQTMEIAWWWHNLFFSFSRVARAIFREIWTEMNFKTVNREL